MIVPRFSTRVVLIVTALCAVYFLLIGLGMRGASWATGFAIALTSLLFAGLVHAALFGLCYLVGQTFLRSPALGIHAAATSGGPSQRAPMVRLNDGEQSDGAACTEGDLT